MLSLAKDSLALVIHLIDVQCSKIVMALYQPFNGLVGANQTYQTARKSCYFASIYLRVLLQASDFIQTQHSSVCVLINDIVICNHLLPIKRCIITAISKGFSYESWLMRD